MISGSFRFRRKKLRRYSAGVSSVGTTVDATIDAAITASAAAGSAFGDLAAVDIGNDGTRNGAA